MTNSLPTLGLASWPTRDGKKTQVGVLLRRWTAGMQCQQAGAVGRGGSADRGAGLKSEHCQGCSRAGDRADGCGEARV